MMFWWYLSLAGVAITLTLMINNRLRWYSPTVIVLFLVALAQALYLSRGEPRPIFYDYFGPGEVTLISHMLEPGVAIYVWVADEDTGAPISYSLPWSDDLAEQLQGVEREVEGENGTEERDIMFNNSPDRDEPMFYPAPWSIEPDK